MAKPEIPITLTAAIIAAFWQKVQKGDWCWEWSTGGKGYGDIAGMKAHRVSFAIHYYVPPIDMEVCHTCDNPRCVRPDHLVLGSHQENMRDAGLKGRKTRPGLGVWDVGKEIEIVALAEKGVKVEQIARQLKAPLRRVKFVIRSVLRPCASIIT